MNLSEADPLGRVACCNADGREVEVGLNLGARPMPTQPSG